MPAKAAAHARFDCILDARPTPTPNGTGRPWRNAEIPGHELRRMFPAPSATIDTRDRRQRNCMSHACVSDANARTTARVRARTLGFFSRLPVVATLGCGRRVLGRDNSQRIVPYQRTVMRYVSLLLPAVGPPVPPISTNRASSSSSSSSSSPVSRLQCVRVGYST